MVNNRNHDREVTFEIVEAIGVIASYSTGWKKELNLVSWNGNTAKYDIRDWDPEHEHMSRGITLHEKEMQEIVRYIMDRSRNKAGGTAGVEASESLGTKIDGSYCREASS